jgi:hypothetical protein
MKKYEESLDIKIKSNTFMSKNKANKQLEK